MTRKSKKMKKLGEAFNLFVCAILSRFNAGTSIIYVENGKNVTLNPNIQGNPEDILWTFNGNKVAEYESNYFQDYGQFRGRSDIHITTGKLTVFNMSSQDSGVYKSAIQIDRKLQNSENEVQVIDAVQEPDVTCMLNNITESKTLFCSVSSQFPTTFEWTRSNRIEKSGQELNISEEEKSDSVFVCTVKNKVSQRSTSFTLKDCPTGKPPHETFLLPVILTIICVILGIAAAAYFICKKRNKGTTDEDANHHDQEDNAEQDTNEEGDEIENDEETKMIDYREPENQAVRNNHEDNAQQNTNEDEDESENREEIKMSDFNWEEGKHAPRNNHMYNAEEEINEDELKNEEETEMMGHIKRNEDATENYEDQYINEDGDD